MANYYVQCEVCLCMCDVSPCYDCLGKQSKQFQAENKRLKDAINAYGNHPDGFDWAVLEKIEHLEAELEGKDARPAL